MLINKTDPIPLYYQVKDKLFKEIEEGTYKPGDRLPAERILASHFNITRVTLRKAVRILEEQGYVQVRPGSGIYVTDRKHYHFGNDGVQKNAKIIGVLVPDIRRGILVDLIRGIEDQAINEGYSTIICNSDNNWDKAMMYMKQIIANKLSGVIFLPIQDIDDPNKKENRNREIIETLYQQNIPVVLVDRACKTYDTDLVVSNNFEGGYEITKYLIEMGHQKIAIIYDFEETTIEDRIAGYKKVLLEHQIPFDQNFIQKVKHIHNPENDVAILKNIVFDLKATAIFAMNDLLAVDVLTNARCINIKIPDDISLVGYDNLPFTDQLSIPLTTVAQPIYQMGIEGFKLLKERIEKKSHYLKKIILPNKLIVRKTVRKLN